MKSKNILIVLTLFVSQITFAQLKVDRYGRIGMGTNWPNPEFKCHIKGNLLLTNYPAIPKVEIRMKVDRYGEATLGSSTNRLLIWTHFTGYNNVYGTRFYDLSDSTSLKNITPLNHALNTIRKFKSYSYNFKKEKKDSIKQEYWSKDLKDNKSFGFLAQEVEQFLPEIVDTAMGLKMIDYTAIIPILTEAIKEQQVQIEALQNILRSQMQDLTELKKKYEECCMTNSKKN